MLGIYVKCWTDGQTDRQTPVKPCHPKTHFFFDSFRVKGKCRVFTLSFGQTDVQTERLTDPWSPVKQYEPDLSMRGIKTRQ